MTDELRAERITASEPSTASRATRVRRSSELPPNVGRGLRYGGPIVFVAALVICWTKWGIPLSRDIFALWLLGGLLAFSLTDLKGWARGLIVDWIPMFVILLAYDLLRGYSTKLFSPHIVPQLDFDKFLGGGTTPTTFLQRHLWNPYHLHWYDYVAWSTYMSHFFVTFVVLAVLWKVRYRLFREYRTSVVALFLAGLATYALFPAVPPWMAGLNGYIPPADRIVGVVSGHMHIKFAATIFEGGSKYANDVAAMPSLHCAFPLLLCLTFFKRAPIWLRPILVAYPLLMAWTLMYGAEHYFCDEVFGWIYATCVYLAVKRYYAWRDAVAERKVAATAAATMPPERIPVRT